jgi:uncharacterized protein (TIGR02147 family)
MRDFIGQLPNKGRGEVNRLATFIGAHPTLVSQVLNGQRDFSSEQILRLGKYFGLPPEDIDYLMLLLQFERAGTNDLKKFYENKIEVAKKASIKIVNRLAEHRRLSEHERSIFYSSWIYMAVWLYTSVNAGQTIDSASQRFQISRAQVSEILTFLKNVGLCKEEEGIYQMQSQYLHLEFGSYFLNSHHTHWRLKSLERIENLTEDELMFTSPFSVSKKDFEKIREEIIQLIKSTSKIIKDSPAEDIACMNFELFWIRK